MGNFRLLTPVNMTSLPRVTPCLPARVGMHMPRIPENWEYMARIPETPEFVEEL